VSPNLSPDPAAVEEFADHLRRMVGAVVDVEEPPEVVAWLSAGVAADWLGLSRRRVTQLCASGGLAARKAGRGWVVDAAAVEVEAEARAEANGNRSAPLSA
jgi:hypothetical protein